MNAIPMLSNVNLGLSNYLTWATIKLLVLTFQSYHNKDSLVATQMPLPSTVADLWRLVQDHSCNTIVMLDHQQDMDEVS